jgi:hypothetical protein
MGEIRIHKDTNNVIVIEITERSEFALGIEFGDVGAYEKLKGRVHFTLDPKASAQAVITDIELAEVNENGLIECASDFCLLRPVDLAKGNRRLFYDYGNRGNARALQFFNDAVGSNDPTTPDHAGNGYLFRRGYSFLLAAWQGDLHAGDGRYILDLPKAINPDGSPVTGRVRTEYVMDGTGNDTLPVSGFTSTRGHPAVSLDTTQSQLTRRRYATDKRQLIDPNDWVFARTEKGPGLDGQGTEMAIIPSDLHIHMPTGFEAGWIYELVYEGRYPLVMGLGHAVIRDLVSFLKYDDVDSVGTANPLGGKYGIAKAYSWGRSQTGRAIRDGLYLGFNADAKGRKVFDGVLAHVAGCGRMWLNHRFASGTSTAGQMYETHDNPADRFPFAYSESTDHVTGKTDGILKRPDTDPLVIHTQTATEYWQRRGSLVHTDSQGNDLAIHENVRIYLWSSSQHYADPLADRPKRGICKHEPNIVRTSMLFRAMLDAMDAWATNDTPPPDNRIPKRSDGTLVDFQTWKSKFPNIPGSSIPDGLNALSHFDYGADPETGVLPKMPPELITENAYTILVPVIDADGNDVAGVRAPMVSAPLATYTGWNVRSVGFGEGAQHWFTGSTIPLAFKPDEQKRSNDPRPSVLERYADKKEYVAAIRKAAEQLVTDGLMIEEDIERCCADAENWDRARS